MRAIVVKTRQELEKCLDIRREVFIREQNVPEDLEVDDLDQLNSAVTHVLVFDDADVPVATARLKPYEPGAAKIQRVAVYKSVRGKGYGAYIMKALEDIALAQEFKKAVLDAQCHAVPFYQKLDYKIISDVFLEAGIEHVRMEKVLA